MVSENTHETPEQKKQNCIVRWLRENRLWEQIEPGSDPEFATQIVIFGAINLSGS